LLRWVALTRRPWPFEERGALPQNVAWIQVRARSAALLLQRSFVSGFYENYKYDYQ